MKTQRAIFVIGCVVVVLFAALALSPSPSKANIQDAKLFCEGINSKTTASEVFSKAESFTKRPVHVVAVDKHLVARIGLCHCSVSFASGKTTTSKVYCNG